MRTGNVPVIPTIFILPGISDCNCERNPVSDTINQDTRKKWIK